MSSFNPYEAPQFGGPGPGGIDPRAAGKVKGPAIALIVTMSFCLVLVVIGLVINLLGVGLGAAAAGQDPEAGASLMFQGTFGLIQGVLGLICGALIIFGSVQMMKLRSYAMAMTACILAMVPFISPCCILGLPFGIWGLVVLCNASVKSAFH